MKYVLILCLILSVYCTACTKPSVQPSVLPEQTSDEMTNSEIDESKGAEIMNMDVAQEYELFIDNAESFLNAPMSKDKHKALRAYENEKIVEVSKKEDMNVVDNLFFEEAPKHVDPSTNEVMPFTVPVHLIFKVTSKDDLKDVLSWFREKKDMVSTLEIRFAKDALDTLDMLVDLRTHPEMHNRVILTSLGDEPVMLNSFHFLVSADVVQISNMVCNNCYALSTKIEASVGKLFEAKRISLSGTKYVQKNKEFLIKTQMLVSSYTSNDEHPDIVFENCYFSDHELEKILSVDEGFEHGYLRNVGFYHNNRLKFGFPVQKKLSMDHVIASDGRVEIRLAGAKPEIEQKDCVLPEGTIVK